MLTFPERKYRRFDPIHLPDRQWPARTIDAPPIWMSTDLRDGNQALIDPMSVETKLRFFNALIAIGFNEIEVGFPSASETDYTFVRRLIEEDRIPGDVTIEVLTQAREELIHRTVESLRGARRAIVHLYNPTAPVFRQIVYRTDRAGIRKIAEHGALWIKEETARHPETEWVYQYSPEAFSSTELDFACEVCDAVSDIWQPTPQAKMILNLPATVEVSTPNIYADQIEWMSRQVGRRDSIVISVHPHNDRGTAVAAAELALMAGAERVEGCLFGNGERTGNVDLVTLALNLYSLGVHPGLDFSQIDSARRVVEECTRIPVHPRHPYAGELVFTAFSGSHQDAIKKGFDRQAPGARWEVPYLPVDPRDLGRNYDAVVRVNSQSGKGGIAFLLQREFGLELPRRLQIEFSKTVQTLTDSTGEEATAGDIYELFQAEYLWVNMPMAYTGCQCFNSGGLTALDIDCTVNGEQRHCEGRGVELLEAAVAALTAGFGRSILVSAKHEHTLGGQNVSYLEMKVDEDGPIFGVGQDARASAALVKALINGINRADRLRNRAAG